MTFVLADRVREGTLTEGVGPFALAGAAAGNQTFDDVLNINDTTWGTIKIPGGAWLSGLLTYTNTDEITVTTVFESSNGGGPVSFGPGTKDIFIGFPASRVQMLNAAPGTRMLFNQTNAPLGWTKVITHNDKLLRVVNGTVSSGGTNAFSTVMAQTVVGSTTLSSSQIPGHTHTGSGTTASENATHSHLYNTAGNKIGLGNPAGSAIYWNSNLGNPDVSSGTQSANHQHTFSFTSASTGGGGSHNHSITLDIQYVDLIIAQKD